jgi:hypothetical protein
VLRVVPAGLPAEEHRAGTARHPFGPAERAAVNHLPPIAKAAAAARELAEALMELASESERAPGSNDAYDSARLPPRTSRRRFAEVCRSGRVSGAVRDGRAWVCPRDAWHAARERAAGTVHESEGTRSLIKQADNLLERSGLRLLTDLPRDPGAE